MKVVILENIDHKTLEKRINQTIKEECYLSDDNDNNFLVKDIQFISNTNGEGYAAMIVFD